MSEHSSIMSTHPRPNDKPLKVSTTSVTSRASDTPTEICLSTSRQDNGTMEPEEVNLISPSQRSTGVSSGIGYQRRPKPPFSYIALIAMAIRASPSGMATLSEINDYLRTKFAFFRGEYSGWRNSVRHNLSLNDCFRKILRDPSRPWGKDNYWTLRETADFTFSDGVFQRKRRRATAAVKKEERTPNSTATNLEKSLKHEGVKAVKQDNQPSRAYNPFTIDNLLKPVSPWQPTRCSTISKTSNGKTNLSAHHARTSSYTPSQRTPFNNKPKRLTTLETIPAPTNQELQKTPYESFLGVPTFSTKGVQPGNSILDHRFHVHPLSFACPYGAHCSLEMDLPTVSYIYSPFHIVTDLQHLPCHISTTYHLDERNVTNM